MLFVGTTNLNEGVLEKQRRLNTEALRTSQKRFKPKVKSSELTRLEFN